MNRLSKKLIRDAAKYHLCEMGCGYENDWMVPFSCCAISKARYWREGNHSIGGFRERWFYELVFGFTTQGAGFWNKNGIKIRCTEKQYYTARVIALELSALLIEDGFTMEDFR